MRVRYTPRARSELVAILNYIGRCEPDGSLTMFTRRLDLDDLLRELD